MEADLKRLKLTWEKDKEVYHAAVMQARSQVESIKINRVRLVVQALVDGEVLQVLYALPKETSIPLCIGPQMDVYIEAAKPPDGIVPDADPTTVKKPFEDEGRR